MDQRKLWTKYSGDLKKVAKYFGEIARVARRKMVLGQMTMR